MFAIKREQREALAEPAFVERTVNYLRDTFLLHVHMLDDAELRTRVKHGIERARSYGLTWESSITIFVTHMLTINPEFDKQKTIKRVLLDADISVNSRMSAMLGLVDDEDWEEATTQCDPEAYWARVRGLSAKED